jgi:hypothetical protein
MWQRVRNRHLKRLLSLQRVPRKLLEDMVVMVMGIFSLMDA